MSNVLPRVALWITYSCMLQLTSPPPSRENTEGWGAAAGFAPVEFWQTNRIDIYKQQTGQQDLSEKATTYC